MKGDKYLDFENYLKNSNKDYLEFTFEQIEGILGQKLAPSAYNHVAYWYHPESHTFPLAWHNAGYKMQGLDLKGHKVSFIKGNALDNLNKEIQPPKLVQTQRALSRTKPSIEVDLVIEKGNEFLKNLNCENSRYLSWEHCYTAFADCKELTEDKIEFLCLHLAFYLASWGMYRGSSFLLWKDYLVHIEAVKEIYNPEYKPLWGISCNDLLTEDNLDLIIKLSDKLKTIYIDKRKDIDDYDGVSDILITKILMGTLGCVPAYDRFFVETLRTYKIAAGSYNKKSLIDLAVYYNENREALDDFKKKLFVQRCIKYPEMKILDMAFWYIAFEKSEDKEDNTI